MDSSRYQLEINIEKAKQYSATSLEKAKAVLTTLTTKIATLEDQEAIAEVKKAYAELKAIKNSLDTQTQKLFKSLPVSFISGRQITHDISHNQQLIDQRLKALRWIIKGNDLADKLDKGEANLNEINISRDWDFDRIQSEDTFFNPLHHTRIPHAEGGDILNALLSRVSERVKESTEDFAMLVEVRKLNAKEEEEKKAQMKAVAEEAKAKEEAEKKATPAGREAEAAAQDKAAMNAIRECTNKIEKALNTTGFSESKKIGILGRSALDKKAAEIRHLCAQTKSALQKGDITQALSGLDKAVELLKQPTKTFFGKKEPPYKAKIVAVMHELKKGLSQRHISKLTHVLDQQSILQSQASKMPRGTRARS